MLCRHGGAVDAVAVYFLEYQPHYSPVSMAFSLIDGPSGCPMRFGKIGLRIGARRVDNGTYFISFSNLVSRRLPQRSGYASGGTAYHRVLFKRGLQGRMARSIVNDLNH